MVWRGTVRVRGDLLRLVLEVENRTAAADVVRATAVVSLSPDATAVVGVEAAVARAGALAAVHDEAERLASGSVPGNQGDSPSALESG